MTEAQKNLKKEALDKFQELLKQGNYWINRCTPVIETNPRAKAILNIIEPKVQKLNSLIQRDNLSEIIDEYKAFMSCNNESINTFNVKN